MIRRGLSLNGKVWSFLTPQAASQPATPVAPSAVVNLSAGTATNSTIPVTYTAAAGDAPITYSGRAAMLGSTTFVTNNGSFGSSGGTFIGLNAGASYNLQIVATNNAGSAVAELDNISTAASTSAHQYWRIQIDSAASSPPSMAEIQMLDIGGVNRIGSGTATASSTFAPADSNGYAPASAVDGNPATCWAAASSAPAWWQYNFGSPVNIVTLVITARTTYQTQAPVSIRFQSSDDGVNFTTQQTYTGLSWNSGETKSFKGTTVTSSSGGGAPAQVVAGQATRFDLKATSSAVTPNTAVAISIIPNGNWAGQTLSLSLAKGSGTLPATLAAPSSGNATISFNYTPTVVGEHSIQATAPGLYSSWPHPINCFAVDNGSAQTLSANLVLDDQAPHQFDVYGAKPTGFSGMDCTGWGEVPMAVSVSGSAKSLWIRLYDALSPGATATVGTGTPLHSGPVQIYGTVSGSATVIPLLPASRKIYRADLATDAAFTNPVRIAKRFSVGMVIATNQRSMECAIARNYSYGTFGFTGTIAGTVLSVTSTPGGNVIFYPGSTVVSSAGNNTVVSYRSGTSGANGTYNLATSQNVPTAETMQTNIPTGQTFATTVTNIAFGANDSPVNTWFRNDGISLNPDQYAYGEASSAGPMRLGELVDHYFGVTLGITGCSMAGGGVDVHINHDGSPSSGFVNVVSQKVRNKFRWFWTNNLGWDGVDSSYPTENVDETFSRIIYNVDYVMKKYSACAVVGLAYGELAYNQDGSAKSVPGGWPGGERRFSTRLISSLGAHVRHKTAAGATNGNTPNSHPGQSTRTTYAEVGFRAFYAGELAVMGGLQTSQTGPTIGKAGTRSGDTVTVPFTHHGGASLVPNAVSYDPYNPARTFQTATAAELASLFTIYAAADGCSHSGAPVVNVAGVAVDNTNNQFIISLVPGQTLPTTMMLQFNCDFGVSNTTLREANPYRAAFFTDERTDPTIGLAFGWIMQADVDIVITAA